MKTNYTTRPSVMRLARTLAPGPSPRSPSGLYPTVLRVPAADYQAFSSHVLARYLDTLKRFWPTAMLASAKNPHPTRVSDERLAEILYHSLMALMLTRQIDDEAAERFAPIFDVEPNKRWLVCDNTALRNVREHMLPGLFCAPSRTLLEETDGEPIVRAIELGGVLLRPNDGSAWELAKLHVRQGLSHSCVMAAHPLNHFPYDTVNGVTRKALPADHILRRLLEPHFYVQLSLNFGVLYSDRSVARNDQAHVYAPFAVTQAGQFGLLRAGWKGVEGSGHWRPYKFPIGLRKTLGPWGDFCRHYEAVIRRHVARILAGVSDVDPHVLRWADEISAHLPGFPSGLRIMAPGVLVEAVSSVIAGVSVLHTSEHFSYAAFEAQELPLRLRVPPPTSAHHPEFRDGDLTTRRDMFRQRMAREMFFKVHPLTLLQDVDYLLESVEHREAAAIFRGELREASRRLPGREYTPLRMMTASLQY
jgi:hypothetical protein